MHGITLRKLEAEFLREDELLKWPCPTCCNDFMTADPEKIFIHPSSVEKTFPYENRIQEGKKEFVIKPGPKQFFSVNLVCDACFEPAVIYGLISEEMDIVAKETEDREEFENLFNVEGISLSLLPINVIIGTPPPVLFFIQCAAKHMFGDIPACANYLRKAAEAIMEERGIKGANLHQKIEWFKQQQQEEGELLMAVKWIGNDGSHLNEKLTKIDIIEAFEALEEVLNGLYNTRREQRLHKAKERNQAYKKAS